jgi:hypothetical protein
MEIKSSSLALQSQNSAHSLYLKREQLQVRFGNTGDTGLSIINTEIKQQDLLTSFKEFNQDNKGLSLQDKANKLAQELNKNNSDNASLDSAKNIDVDPFANMSAHDKLKMMLIYMLLSRVQKDPKLMKALGLDADCVQASENIPQPNINANQNNNSNVPAAAAASPVVEYQAQEMLFQSQTSQFAAHGQIKTADGQTINFNVNLVMSSQTVEFSDTRIRLQSVTKDPLVINLDGSAAALSNQRFSFDLMGDGTQSLIPELSGNRAFLVLDKNKDGTVNNGKELFGPQTNDGFKELAQYDQDKNGWIDESDPIYQDLKLWINAGTQSERLISLKDAGIGALYVGSATTSFILQGTQGPQDYLGTIQSTGIFLKEDGSVGTIQHIDLTV